MALSLFHKITGGAKYLEIFRDALLFGKYYINARQIIRQLDKMTEDDIRAYHYSRLRAIIEYSYQNIPYYNDLFDRIGFKPEDFRKPEDIRHIPYLTKAQICENHERLIPAKVPSKYLKRSVTGGSTGKPMVFYLDRRTSSHVDFAYQMYIWKRIGYRFRDKCVVMRGDTFDQADERNCWRMNYPMNWLIMSSLRLNRDTVSIYLEKIRKFDPKYLIIYPSNAYILARYAKERNIDLCKSLRGVICSSETLYDWQKQYIERGLKVPVYSYYGLSEKCCLASGFTDSVGYEFIPAYCYTEIVNKAGNECSADGELGEIVCTGLNSIAAPMIRYRTNDVAVFSEHPRDNHGGWKTVKEIRGRISEFIVDNKGSLITFTCSDEIFWQIIEKLNAYQYVQVTPGKLLIRLEINQPLTDLEYNSMKANVAAYYPGFEVGFTIVENIPKTRIGKFRYLIQELKIDFHT